MKRDIRLLINKSEITAGTRGASLGPESIMTAARKIGDDYFGQYPIDYVAQFNHLLDEPIKFPHAKRIEGLVKVFESVSTKVEEVLNDKAFPIVIAADHGSAGGTIAGVKAAHPSKRLGIVWIDAHGDLHTPYTTPSGNMHGMPLATALSEDNLQEGKQEISEKEKELWTRLKEMKIPEPKVLPQDIVFVAVRDTEKEEDALIERLNIKNHSVDSIRENGLQSVVDAIFDQLIDCDMIYVSFDVDSMDPIYTSHGTGTPVDHGLKPVEAEFFLTELVKNKKTVCVEFVEVNPCLDEKTNKMAEVTFDLLKKTTIALENS